ncbi:hypothetical protein L596_025194 [Steinernema carpocapsae]|uniref:Uncharacterized protein n=1 Tax=Steinernema carpocapsae TaxID=34508 RepID=A0A4U5M755_STECR|nr:hypothetical protein L596_025194 [Steinernema carpocapsae]
MYRHVEKAEKVTGMESKWEHRKFGQNSSLSLLNARLQNSEKKDSITKRLQPHNLRLLNVTKINLKLLEQGLS